jgi:hypothetical protein
MTREEIVNLALVTDITDEYEGSPAFYRYVAVIDFAVKVHNAALTAACRIACDFCFEDIPIERFDRQHANHWHTNRRLCTADAIRDLIIKE